MVTLERQNFKDNTKRYNKEVKRIRNVIGKDYPINHVGSTALPYMIGKNIIDILIGVSNDNEMEDLTKKLKQLGFYPGKKSNGNIYRFFASTEKETKAPANFENAVKEEDGVTIKRDKKGEIVKKDKEEELEMTLKK